MLLWINSMHQLTSTDSSTECFLSLLYPHSSLPPSSIHPPPSLPPSLPPLSSHFSSSLSSLLPTPLHWISTHSPTPFPVLYPPYCRLLCTYIHVHIPQSQCVDSLRVLAFPEKKLPILVPVQQLLSFESTDRRMEPRHRQHGNGTAMHDGWRWKQAYISVGCRGLIVLVILRAWTQCIA